jgi:hypothetical protein
MDHSPRESFDMQAPYYTSRSGSDDKMQLVMDAAAATGDHSISDSQNLMILALPQDRASLSETLCVVREVSKNTGKLFTGLFIPYLNV